MSKVDKIMSKFSMLKNLALPAGWQGQSGQTSRNNPGLFQFGQFGQVPDKLFAPWSAPEPKNVSSYIAPVQFQRIRHDINLWREAIRETELAILPFRVRMQRMYVDTVLNPHVQALMLRRKELTLLREFYIVDSKGNPIDELTEFFNKKWFYDFQDLALDAIFYGYSLIQLGDIINNEVSEIGLVRRFNVSPDRRCVSVFEYAVTGIPFDDPEYSKWLVYVPTQSEIGISKCGYGLLYKIANYELYHRQVFQQNADYAEMFVHPFRLAKTNKTQADEDRVRLEQMLQNMGAQPWGVVDKEDDIEFVKDSSGTGFGVYGDFAKRLEAMMSKVILGHADALDSTPGKLGSGQGDESPVWQALEDKKNVDAKFIQHVFNTLLIPKLQGLGIKGLDGIKLQFRNNSEKLEGIAKEGLALKSFAEALVQLKQAGFSIDPKIIEEKTGLKVEATEVDNSQEDVRSQMLNNKIRLMYNHAH